jgi:hypothetical protein
MRRSHTKQREREMIWQCRFGDGVYRYFEHKVEAEFFAKDATAAGFTVITSEIALPKTPKEFVAFMESVLANHHRFLLAMRDAEKM